MALMHVYMHACLPIPVRHPAENNEGQRTAPPLNLQLQHALDGRGSTTLVTASRSIQRPRVLTCTPMKKRCVSSPTCELAELICRARHRHTPQDAIRAVTAKASSPPKPPASAAEAAPSPHA